MGDDLHFTVQPRAISAAEPHPGPVQPVVLGTREKRDVEGLGVLKILLVLFGSAAGVYVVTRSIALTIIAAWLTTIIVTVAYRQSKISQLKRQRIAECAAEQLVTAREHTARRESASREEAAELSTRLKDIYRWSANAGAAMQADLDNASGWLRHAESEHRQRAFGPFWDAVEDAAVCLASVDRKIHSLDSHANLYYQLLADRTHNFPNFPASVNDIPDSSGVLRHLDNVVRMGQTDFEFANIWEHRQTRQVMIAGFGTLRDALAGIGGTLQDSISGLERSMSSDTAHLVEEQIASRELLDYHMLEQQRLLKKG